MRSENGPSGIALLRNSGPEDVKRIERVLEGGVGEGALPRRGSGKTSEWSERGRGEITLGIL